MNLDFSLAAEKLQRMLDGAILALPNVVLALLVVTVFVLIARAIRATAMRISRRSGQSRYAAIVLGRLAQWVVLLLGLLVGFSIVFPSLSAADLVGLLGIGGIAIGFAFRDIAQNFLGVCCCSLRSHSGWVTRLSLMSLRARSRTSRHAQPSSRPTTGGTS